MHEEPAQQLAMCLETLEVWADTYLRPGHHLKAVKDLLASVSAYAAEGLRPAVEVKDGRIVVDLGLELLEMQREYVLAVWHRNRLNNAATADALGISADTVARYLKEWGFTRVRKGSGYVMYGPDGVRVVPTGT